MAGSAQKETSKRKHITLVTFGYAAHLCLITFAVWPTAFSPMFSTEVLTQFVLFQQVKGFAFVFVFFIAAAVLTWCKTHALLKINQMIGCMVCCVSVGLLILIYGSVAQPHCFPLVYVSGALVGIGSGVGFVLWQQAFSLMPLKAAAISMACGTSLSALVYFVIDWIPVCYIAFPVCFFSIMISCISLFYLSSDIDKHADKTFSNMYIYKLKRCLKEFWLAAIAIAAIAFVCGIFYTAAFATPFSDYLTDLYSLGRLSAAVILVLIIVRHGYKIDLDTFVQRVLPFCATAGFLTPFLGVENYFVLSAAFYVVFGLSSMVVMLACNELSKRYGLHPAMPYCLIFGFVYLSYQIGCLSGKCFFFSFKQVSSFTQIFMIALFIVYLFALLSIFEFRKSKARYVSRSSLRKDKNLKEGKDVEIEIEIRLFAEEYTFTQREIDVFSLIIWGRDVTRISEQLFISKSTVRSYVKNIYQKTGVNSRQKLIDIWNIFRSGSPLL